MRYPSTDVSANGNSFDRSGRLYQFDPKVRIGADGVPACSRASVINEVEAPSAVRPPIKLACTMSHGDD